MNNGFFVCLTKEHVASAHIAEAYLIDSSEGQFLPAFRALEFKGDCAVSNGADSAHLWCLTPELTGPALGRFRSGYYSDATEAASNDAGSG